MQNRPFSIVRTPVGASTFKKTRARRLTALALAGSLALSGCAGGAADDLSREDKLAIGAMAGAAVGALVGYEFFGGGNGRWLFALAGGALGAYGGEMLADRLTQYDQASMQETAYTTLSDAPSGETGTWANPETGTTGSITPVRTFLDSQGRVCREYDAAVTVGGETFEGREAACRTKAGHWVAFAQTS